MSVQPAPQHGIGPEHHAKESSPRKALCRSRTQPPRPLMWSLSHVIRSISHWSCTLHYTRTLWTLSSQPSSSPGHFKLTRRLWFQREEPSANISVHFCIWPGHGEAEAALIVLRLSCKKWRLAFSSGHAASCHLCGVIRYSITQDDSAVHLFTSRSRQKMCSFLSF